MKGFNDLLTYDKSIWLYPNGFCLVDSTSTPRQQMFFYADGDILSVKAMEFFKTSASDASNVEIVVANEPPVIVPKDLYQEEDAMKFVALQYEVGRVTRTFACDMEKYKLIFFLYQNEENALARLPFPKKYTSYWDLIYRNVKAVSHPRNLIWLAEHERYLDVYVEKNEVVMLLTRFDYVTAEDELYHVLNLRHQFQLGEAEVRIVSDNSCSPFKTLIKKYLNNYSWID